MSTIKELFFSHEKNIVHKWHHYLDIYDKWFSPYKNVPIVIMEIGVYMGGSLQIWKKYFHPQSIIVGLDINPSVKIMEKEKFKIIIGNQNDIQVLNSIDYKFDIIIDDGSHIQSDIIASFENLWDKLNFGGIYVIEDVHASYLNDFGGELKKENTAIEYSKNIIDYMNARHIKEKDIKNKWTNEISGVHFYESMIVIEKNVNNTHIDSKQGRVFI